MLPQRGREAKYFVFMRLVDVGRSVLFGKLFLIARMNHKERREHKESPLLCDLCVLCG